jgi:hypothetical protein
MAFNRLDHVISSGPGMIAKTMRAVDRIIASDRLKNEHKPVLVALALPSGSQLDIVVDKQCETQNRHRSTCGSPSD